MYLATCIFRNLPHSIGIHHSVFIALDFGVVTDNPWNWAMWKWARNSVGWSESLGLLGLMFEDCIRMRGMARPSWLIISMGGSWCPLRMSQMMCSLYEVQPMCCGCWTDCMSRKLHKIGAGDPAGLYAAVRMFQHTGKLMESKYQKQDVLII